MQTKLWKLETKRDQAIAEAAALIRKGEVVAFPTETVYGLGANGLDGMACRKIFAAKGRPADNPLILHIAEKEDMEALTKGLSPMAQALMEAFWPGPMTLIVPKSDKIPDVVTAGLDTVAVRFPSHPVARDLIRRRDALLQPLQPTNQENRVRRPLRMCSLIWTVSLPASLMAVPATSVSNRPSLTRRARIR